jgi:hypothetical protein
MALFTQFSFNAAGIRSLCWRGDQLIDWVSGGRVFAADGTEQPAKVRYAYRFDTATASPDGRFAVINEKLGTKGLLLRAIVNRDTVTVIDFAGLSTSSRP